MDIQKRRMGRFQLAVFDGAETLVGFGSFASAAAFVMAAATSGIEVTIGEVWAPTGTGRRQAVRALWQTSQGAPTLHQSSKTDTHQPIGVDGGHLVDFHTQECEMQFSLSKYTSPGCRVQKRARNKEIS